MNNKKVLMGLGCCIGILLICCVTLVGLVFLAPSLTESLIESSAPGPDKSFTRFSSAADAKKTQDESTTKIFNAAFSEALKNPDAKSIEIKLTEKEMLSFFFTDESKVEDKLVDDIGIKIEEGSMKMQMSMDFLNKYANDKDSKGSSDDKAPTCKALDDLNLDITKMKLYPTMEFQVVNNQFAVKDVSFGSSIVDSMCEKDIKKYADKTFNDALNNEEDKDSGTKVEFKKDEVVMTIDTSK